jgi:carboxylesterase type B
VISVDAARRIGELFAEKLGVAPTHEAMAAVPYDRIIAAHAALDADVMSDPDPQRWGISMAGAMLTQPVIDGDVIPSAPLERVQHGASATVDLIVGTNLDDWRMFLAFTGELGRITDRMLTGAVTEYGPQSVAAYGLPAERALAFYRLAHSSATPGELLAAIQTDWWCRIPAIRLADAHVSDVSRTYMYEFWWPSPAANGLFGACHALEIPFVFDTLDKGPDQMLGDLLAGAPQELATAMHNAWVSFIARGDAQWPEYDLRNRTTMVFDTVSRPVNDPRAAERALWEGTR